MSPYSPLFEGSFGNRAWNFLEQKGDRLLERTTQHTPPSIDTRIPGFDHRAVTSGSRHTGHAAKTDRLEQPVFTSPSSKAPERQHTGTTRDASQLPQYVFAVEIDLSKDLTNQEIDEKIEQILQKHIDRGKNMYQTEGMISSLESRDYDILDVRSSRSKIATNIVGSYQEYEIKHLVHEKISTDELQKIRSRTIYALEALQDASSKLGAPASEEIDSFIELLKSK